MWVGGEEVARHRGGFTSFTADLGVRADEEELTIVVRARDTRDEPQARGKQATWFANTHCQYTRTTGIWQTVWLESVPQAYLERPRITPDANVALDLDAPVRHGRVGQRVPAADPRRVGEVLVEVDVRRSRDVARLVLLATGRSAHEVAHVEDGDLAEHGVEFGDGDER